MLASLLLNMPKEKIPAGGGGFTEQKLSVRRLEEILAREDEEILTILAAAKKLGVI